MINFYPGPSKIYPEYKQIVHDLLTNGHATYNHRSPEFQEYYKKSVSVLKEKLDVPDDYELFFLSSATECWESISQTFSDYETAFLHNGSFGKKWSEIGKAIMKRTKSFHYDQNESIEAAINQVSRADLIAYVHNETSNGTVVRKPFQMKIRADFPDALIAVDATSSLGAAQIDYPSTDIVFASVQKCLGMPAGLAVMIISPKVVDILEKFEFAKHYNDLNEILHNHKKNQTTHTPNILNIISIGKLFEEIQPLRKSIEKIYTRADIFEHFINNNSSFEFLTEKTVRSKTVFCIKHPNVDKIISQAKLNSIILGRGYGVWKENTIRIANFPAHSNADFEELKHFLSTCK